MNTLSPGESHSLTTARAAERSRLKNFRRSMFSSPLQAALTLMLAVVICAALVPLMNWAVFGATFVADSANTCRQHASGACWAFIGEKYRLILFGTYPYHEQWRPLLATVLLVGVIVGSGNRFFWNYRIVALWGIGLVLAAVLMWGGVLGLRYVEDESWGGLPVTLMFATFGIGIAFPLGVLLALGRRSRMPAIKTLCVVYIELIRGVPLISVLFMSSVMLPLFLPEGFSIDKLLRAQLAIIFFAAAYVAEVVRGGLQAVPKGQYEGAESIGLTFSQRMLKIILPQALRVVIGPLVSTFITLFKETSLVVVIGIFDLTLSARAALADSAWGGFDIEAYVFISAIYFVFCYSMSRFSRALEATLSKEHK
ncbi:amino acid ABC transporter permease [Burkholderia cenocepacia]|uniref:amino acid ABC transporter permease n=1 Tax=Burkholderia cenocepacia TaxID=95486 RepID=UPI00068E284A|nr:amino acid ABC transporter permease [Burkholderia cenocepacia]MCW3614711.1 amino acid ABC transporter permease [Burkholderia cenocepacia]MCW3652649.1 amino acid ABC transporter permease [Burkholderia cenocepacia]MCW3667621.1 amino acid ABC transporter permease [Burkholderia cenocepacia]MCW3682372.1 amino acid ABC transporter permease [Burkholderia cenocepacia]